MEFIRLESAADRMFREAMALYAVSFPEHEQREDASQKEILGWDEYHFELLYDGDVFVGIILYWETEDFIYVEHFCIRPELRGKRYGQRALDQLGRKDKIVILEIDPPVDAVSVSRQAFYQRAGYAGNPYRHIHPPYHRGREGHELAVLSFPRGLTREEYDRFNRYLCGTVMRAAAGPGEVCPVTALP